VAEGQGHGNNAHFSGMLQYCTAMLPDISSNHSTVQ